MIRHFRGRRRSEKKTVRIFYLKHFCKNIWEQRSMNEKEGTAGTGKQE